MTRREWVFLRLRSLPGSTIVRGMQSPLSYRHRLITEDDLGFIRRLVADHPGASRWALSRKLCEAWSWVQANGTLRDMVCRGMMLMLRKRSANPSIHPNLKLRTLRPLQRQVRRGDHGSRAAGA